MLTYRREKGEVRWALELDTHLSYLQKNKPKELSLGFLITGELFC